MLSYCLKLGSTTIAVTPENEGKINEPLPWLTKPDKPAYCCIPV